MRIINAAEAIREATEQAMELDESVIIIGEGVPDPKACFGTTRGLKDKFPSRVFDMPISENGGVGFCIGASLNGLKPIMVHMRQDFLMYAMDQIVNNAAKWYQMYGGQKSVPIVIRAFTGRGWGQGIQHSQNLEAMFAHVPGLKVVCPSNALNAKGLLASAILDPNPVIFLEHRWVHSITSDVPEEEYVCQIGKSYVAREGKDITLVSWGYPLTECLKAAEFLEKQGIGAEVIDVRTLRPLDLGPIVASHNKTKKMLVVSDAWGHCGVAQSIAFDCYCATGGLVGVIINNDSATPPAPNLTKDYYPTVLDIVTHASAIIGWPFDLKEARKYQNQLVHDVPNPDFKGPF